VITRFAGPVSAVSHQIEQCLAPKAPPDVRPARRLPRRASLDVVLGVAAAPSYGKPWIAFARQKFTRSGFDERSNHLE
jgi:hypothetical protein